LHIEVFLLPIVQGEREAYSELRTAFGGFEIIN